MGGTSSQVRVNSFARCCPQLRVGAVDVNGEALFQVLQPQLHWVLGLQMLQDPLDQEALLSSGAAVLPQSPNISNQGSRSRRLPTSTHRETITGGRTHGETVTGVPLHTSVSLSRGHSCLWIGRAADALLGAGGPLFNEPEFMVYFRGGCLNKGFAQRQVCKSECN